MQFQLRDNVFVIGDMHGNLQSLMHSLSIQTSKTYFPDGSDIILLGDCGIVNKGIPNDYRAANKKAAKRDIRIYVFRGNHDNPKAYSHHWQKEDPQLSNVYIMEDLDEFVFPNGKQAIVIPGAVSIDRSYRWGNNWCWFPDEATPALDKLDDKKKYSIIFSHSGPRPPCIVNDPGTDCGFFSDCCKKDKNLLKDLADEQTYWSNALKDIEPERIYFGHYHCSEDFEVDGVRCRVCDIGEIVPVIY